MGSLGEREGTFPSRSAEDFASHEAQYDPIPTQLASCGSLTVDRSTSFSSDTSELTEEQKAIETADQTN